MDNFLDWKYAQLGNGRVGLIHLYSMIQDDAADLVGAQLARLKSVLNGGGGWSGEKQYVREKLDSLAEHHGYIGFWADPRDFYLARVGQSFQYLIPSRQRGWLARFAGQHVRIICIRSGKFRRWVRVGLVKGVD